MTAAASPSALVTKWRVSKASADEKASRVRDNQRRHRARVKDHIATLEATLESTQRQLNAALTVIGQLSAEVETLRRHGRVCAAPRVVHDEETGDAASAQITNNLRFETRFTDGGVVTNLPDGAEAEEEPQINTRVPEDTSLQPAICCAHQPSSKTEALSKAADTQEKSDWSDPGDDYPTTVPGESTTTCAAAAVIIEQQNIRGLDAGTVNQFLRPGFRTANRPGDGCRVETGLLYSLVDLISS
ncbi:hypothetical protein GQ53DRAFT_435895 [Thozetella sp. PMI_491]|nr:hypothetical protein GQ53DRAFT_435895 [Thozetella sp. PMI_491]